MKKCLIMIFLSIVLSSCSSVNNKNPINLHDSTESLYETSMDDVLPSSAEPLVRSEKKVLIPEEDLVYINDSAGYQIAFPESWRGYYVITEYSPDEVSIGFYGKSKTGKIAYEHYGMDGLEIGCIVSEIPVEGRNLIDKIGEINGVDYFLTSATGGTYLPTLEEVISSDNNSIKEFINYEIDETELMLVAQDLEKAIPMRDDLYDMRITFSPISSFDN